MLSELQKEIQAEDAGTAPLLGSDKAADKQVPQIEEETTSKLIKTDIADATHLVTGGEVRLF